MEHYNMLVELWASAGATATYDYWKKLSPDNKAKVREACAAKNWDEVVIRIKQSVSIRYR